MLIRGGSQTRLVGKNARTPIEEPSHSGGHVIPDEHRANEHVSRPYREDHYLEKSSEKLYQMLKEGSSQKVWRNAYYLSTSIEEDNMR